MSPILSAIFSNLSYAIGDNCNGWLSKKNSPLKIAFWATLFGIVIFLIPAVIFFGDEFSKLTVSNTIQMLAINVLGNIGYLSFIYGMSRGSVTVTGVVGGSFPAVTTLVALIFFGESISSFQGLAVALIIFGVILASMSGKLSEFSKQLKTSGTLFALGAFFFWGVYFALVRIPIEKVGYFLPQYTSSYIGTLMFALLAYKTKSFKEVSSKPNLAWLIALTALMQVAGSIFFNYAISKGQTAIIAPIAGSSPAVFVFLAYFIFKEKLAVKQWVGIALTLSGIITLSIIS